MDILAQRELGGERKEPRKIKFPVAPFYKGKLNITELPRLGPPY
jgi:hypothetical protein